jgi:SAM-dependent methyltransferase
VKSLPVDTLLEETRRSWDVATANHNAHKVDQGRWLRDHSTLFPEELELLGPIAGCDLLHLCCNSGQDTISLVRHHGVRAVGVDFSSVAVETARNLAREAAAEIELIESEVSAFLDRDRRSFDIVFGSYGFLPWMLDLPRVLRGIADHLRPGGRFVVVEFHPLAWSFDEHFQLADPYFAPNRLFSAPVSDYVGEAGGALSPSGHRDAAAAANPHPAHAAQHTVADIVSAALDAGLRLEALREWSYANGCRIHRGLVAQGASGLAARRFAAPAGVPAIPLMLGMVAQKV